MGRRRTSEKGRRSGLPWFKVRNDIANHPKIADLAALIAELKPSPRHMALGFLVEVFCHASKYAPTGEIPNGARTAHAVLANVFGSATDSAPNWDAVVDAMVRVNLLEDYGDDGLEVHDWWQEQGPHIERAWKDAEQKRKDRDETKGKIRRAPNPRRSRDESANNARTPALEGEGEVDGEVNTSSSFPPPDDEPPRGARKAKRGGGEGRPSPSANGSAAPRTARPAGTAAKVVALPLRSKLLDIPEVELDPSRPDHCHELLQRYRVAAFQNDKAREAFSLEDYSRFVSWHIRWMATGLTGWDIANGYLLYLRDDAFKRHAWALKVWMTDGVCEQRMRAAASGDNALTRRGRRL